MSPHALETKRAASVRPTARETNQTSSYSIGSTKSSRKAITQAADVLTLLALFRLTTAERTGFAALLQRRLERAYGRAL